MTLDSVTARGVRGVLACRYVSSATVMRPPLEAAIDRNCDAIQSRAAKTPCVAVELFSEKSLRVPNATSRSSVLLRRPASTAETSAAIAGCGETCGAGEAAAQRAAASGRRRKRRAF